MLGGVDVRDLYPYERGLWCLVDVMHTDVQNQKPSLVWCKLLVSLCLCTVRGTGTQHAR